MRRRKRKKLRKASRILKKYLEEISCTTCIGYMGIAFYYTQDVWEVLRNTAALYASLKALGEFFYYFAEFAEKNDFKKELKKAYKSFREKYLSKFKYVYEELNPIAT